MSNQHLSQELASFASKLQAKDIPLAVMSRAEDFLVDWFGSAVAGKGSRPVEIIAQFAQNMGGFNTHPGPSEILVARKSSSPFLAAMANAAASHVAEQDDVHNGSVFHPATVVFPPALACAQAIGASGEDLLVAAVAGYEVGIRVGEFLGRSHYKVFHTTGTAGTIAAAATVGRLLNLNPHQMLHAFGSAGTQSAGLWEFLRDAADSKQLHTAHAASTGLMSAYIAQAGFTGAQHILEGKQGLAAGMSSDANPSKLVDQLGTRAVTNTRPNAKHMARQGIKEFLLLCKDGVFASHHQTHSARFGTHRAARHGRVDSEYAMDLKARSNCFRIVWCQSGAQKNRVTCLQSRPPRRGAFGV